MKQACQRIKTGYERASGSGYAAWLSEKYYRQFVFLILQINNQFS